MAGRYPEADPRNLLWLDGQQLLNTVPLLVHLNVSFDRKAGN